MSVDHRCAEPTTIQLYLDAIYVSLELSRSRWLITSLSPGGGEKLSQHILPAGDTALLLAHFAELRGKALARTGQSFGIIAIQEAGLDGFWLHRVLEEEGVESHVVDAASVAVPRRRRRAKTDSIDGALLLRTLRAYKRGEPRVCSMVEPPSADAEDERRCCRERQVLITERGQHVNRIKGLLFAQGISDYRPLRRDRRRQLEGLRTGDGRALPVHVKAQIGRELDRLELLLKQIEAVEAERDAVPVVADVADAVAATKPAALALLTGLKGIGMDSAALLWSEGLSRHFANRRRVAAYAGLAATPWQSGAVAHEQGVSKSGNPRLRTMLVQLSWLWLRHQPGSALSAWFHAYVGRSRQPGTRKRGIIGLARKLLVALWKYVNHGVVIEGAVGKTRAAA